MKSNIRIILLTLLTVLLVSGLGAIILIYSGLYPIGATSPHHELEVRVITWVKRRAIQTRAENLQLPNLEDAKLIERGFGLYQQKCLICHGAPGDSGAALVQGLNPNAPPLVQAKDHWTHKEIAWIIKNGIKMTGMPGYELGQDSQELHALTAFVSRLNSLSVDEYEKMLAYYETGVATEPIRWLPPDQGWAELQERGQAERGRVLLQRYGCGGCHRIPGVVGAVGRVGPPLFKWSERHYIAGRLINNPNNLAHWIRYPQEVESHTMMPEIEMSEQDAWDMTRYLFSLGEGESFRSFRDNNDTIK